MFARNIFWSLIGTILPLAAAVFAIPQLIAALGAAQFGVLTLAWTIVGYFSFFDFGLGRALTKLVAERIGRKDEYEIPSLVRTALTFSGSLGLVAAVIVWLIAPTMVIRYLQIPDELVRDTTVSFRALAISIPFVVASVGLRGILEAYQRFPLLAALQAPIGVLTFVGPLLVLPYSSDLSWIVAILVGIRIASFVLYVSICWHEFPLLRENSGVDREIARDLLAYGGWMTASNIAGPLLLYLGRIVITAQLSTKALAYFVTPYEIVTRLLAIPNVLVAVLFPAFSSLSRRDAQDVRRLYRKAMIVLAVAIFPLTMAALIGAERVLSLWINAEFSENGYRVAQILAVGVFINSFGYISQALIQAFGRPDWTAKLHVAELVLYVPYLTWLTTHFGINGAAAAWTVRVTISTVFLYYLARKCLIVGPSKTDKERA